MNHRYSAEVGGISELPAGDVLPMADKAACTPRLGCGFVSRETKRSLSAMQGGEFMLLRHEFGAVALTGARAHINLHHEKSYTRQASRNQVGFGQLVIKDADSRERVEYVAVKPLDTPGRAAREFGAMQTVNELAARGNLSPALRPLGFYKDREDGRVSLLTKYEHDILTLDNIFWDPNFTPSERQLRAAMGHCAVSLGELHSNGIAHTDAQVKNIAADNRGVRYVDLEGAQELVAASGLVNPVAARHLIEMDVRECLESYNGVGVEFIEESFTPPYLDIVTSEGSFVPQEAVLDPQEIAHMTW